MRDTSAPTKAIKNTTRMTSTGAARTRDTRAVTTSAMGATRAASIGYVKNQTPPLR